MKKVLSLLLIAVLCFGLMTGCGGEELIENPYAEYDLASLVTLPDYHSYSFEEEEVTVNDADIDDTIQVFLQNMATTENVTEGVVEKGDTVKIAYEGTLADGTTSEGMKSDGATLTLGNGGYIDGFEAGLYGATIGQPVTLELQFPDPYPNNPDLAGKDVTFEVTVLSKSVYTIPELTDKLVKDNTNYSNIKKFREAAAKELEKLMTEEEVMRVKGLIYNQIFKEAEVSEVIEQEVEVEMKRLEYNYRESAEAYQLEWEDFLEQYLSFDEETFQKELRLYGEDIVRSKMIVYAMAEAEDVAVTQSEFDDALNEIMLSYGISEPSIFETYMGYSIEEYAAINHTLLDLTLDKILNGLYDEVVTKAN